MKLLFCETCGSMFSLAIGKMKECDCGIVKGMYVDRRNAVSNGKGVALGMGTGSLSSAVDMMHWLKGDAPRETYLEQNQVITWVRPHFGQGNPHTKPLPEGGKE